jgi:hypothetical protein
VIRGTGFAPCPPESHARRASRFPPTREAAPEGLSDIPRRASPEDEGPYAEAARTADGRHPDRGVDSGASKRQDVSPGRSAARSSTLARGGRMGRFRAVASLVIVVGASGCVLPGVLRESSAIGAEEQARRDAAIEIHRQHHQSAMDAHEAAVRLHRELAEPPPAPPLP